MDEGLSPRQKLYFQNSKVRDGNGNLMRMYHGSGTKIEAFNPTFTGQGYDQYGSGFYFTSDERFAQQYTELRRIGANGKPMEKLGGEDNPSIAEVYLNLENPIIIDDGHEQENLSEVLIPNDKVLDIIKELPSLYHEAGDEESPNPLEDYLDEFWEVNPHTKEEFEPLIEKMAYSFFQNTDLRTLDLFFEKYGTSTDLRKAINKVLGYDGIIVNFGDSQHAVAWFPEQIKDVNNLNPKVSPYLMDDPSKSLHDRSKVMIRHQVKDSMELRKEITKNFDRLNEKNLVIAFDRDKVLQRTDILEKYLYLRSPVIEMQFTLLDEKEHADFRAQSVCEEAVKAICEDNAIAKSNISYVAYLHKDTKCPHIHLQVWQKEPFLSRYKIDNQFFQHLKKQINDVMEKPIDLNVNPLIAQDPDIDEGITEAITIS